MAIIPLLHQLLRQGAAAEGAGAGAAVELAEQVMMVAQAVVVGIETILPDWPEESAHQLHLQHKVIPEELVAMDFHLARVAAEVLVKPVVADMAAKVAMAVSV